MINKKVYIRKIKPELTDCRAIQVEKNDNKYANIQDSDVHEVRSNSMLRDCNDNELKYSEKDE